MSQNPVGPDRGSTTGTPTWVKVFGIIFGILVAMVVILHLTGNSLGGHTSPTEHGVQKP